MRRDVLMLESIVNTPLNYQECKNGLFHISHAVKSSCQLLDGLLFNPLGILAESSVW